MFGRRAQEEAARRERRDENLRAVALNAAVEHSKKHGGKNVVRLAEELFEFLRPSSDSVHS